MEKVKKGVDTVLPSSRAGVLQSALSVELHTHYAIRLWEGRKRSDSNSGEKKRPEIISMPKAIQRAGIASRDSASDNPYADMVLVKLETIINLASDKISKIVNDLEVILSAVPKGITLSDVASVCPLNISIYSRSPLGYRCVWLLVGYDQLAMKAFHAFHYGLISRAQRDQYLNIGGHAVRQVYGVIQPYYTVAVNRNDIVNLTARGQEALARLGEPDPDIFSGKKRSSFSAPLSDRQNDKE
ncbi:TIGR03761 family integrating conjugative element protein [Enterobacteriaceae bacterium ESL0689]|nr:TIGR03761 family integrating conjugative element protein [Enterobacteriaceae bacterium ESL0689]